MNRLISHNAKKCAKSIRFPCTSKNKGMSSLSFLSPSLNYELSDTFYSKSISSSSSHNNHQSAIGQLFFNAASIHQIIIDYMNIYNNNDNIDDISNDNLDNLDDNSGIWYSSTMKKRRIKMNKHKLKKRRKLRRFNTKKSRQ